MFKVDRARGVLLIKKDSVVVRHLRFDGRVVAGMFTNFWGNIEADEVYLAKGCVVGGDIICRRAVIGAYTRFRRIFADEDVFIQDKCVGQSVKAKNVRISSGSVIGVVEADESIVVDGASKLGKLNARRIVATEGKI